MNKVLEFLEAHCQWVAVALGGVFLAMMLWSYILMQPVAVEGANQTTLTPGNVDDEVFRRSAEPLDRELRRQQVEAPPVQSQTSVSKAFEDTLRGKDRPLVTLGDNWPGSLPMKLDDLEGIKDQKPIQVELVKVLPVVPASEPSAIKAARVNANDLPPVAGAPAPAGAPGQLVLGRDLNYVFYQYRINTGDLGNAFKAAGIGANQPLTTSILAVKVFRQEQRPDGSWSAAVEVKPLKNAPALMAVPANAAPGDPTTINFLTWVESVTGIADLIRPPFYEVIMGEGPWSAPEELPVIDPVAEREAKRLAAEKAAAERTAERARNRPAPTQRPPEEDMTPPEGRRGRRGAGGPRGLAEDVERPGRYDELVGKQFAQVRPGGVFGNPNNPDENGMPQTDPDGNPLPDGMQPGNPNQAPGQLQANGLPQNRFNPQIPGIGNFDGWTYDDEVEEGKTYRYQVVYAIRNPVFGTQGIAQAGLEKTFALWFNDGKPHDDHWSQSVTIQPTTEYFLTSNNNWGGQQIPDKVQFEIYKWAAGKWQRSSKTFSVGDRIGTIDSKGGMKVTFATGASLVDIRFDSKLGKSYVVVLDHTGKLIELDAVQERNNPRRIQLQAAVQPPAAANAGGPGAPVAGR